MSLSIPRQPYVARVAAILLPAGAWDVAATPLECDYAMSVELYFIYTRGGAAGSFRWRMEVSPDTVATTWYRTSIYEAGIVAPGGADVMSRVQREEFEYASAEILAVAEPFAVGPIRIEDGVHWVRFPAAEVGNVGAPGNLTINAMLSSEK